MIKPLKRVIVDNYDDGTQVSKLPSNEDMMNKINEIIEYVNKHDKSIKDQHLRDIFKPKAIK